MMSEQQRLFVVRKDRVPDLPGMMLATIRALKSLGGSGTIQEIEKEIIKQENIPESEQSIKMENGRNKLSYCLAWARTYLKRGGVIVNSSRGVWALTEDGEKVKSIEQVRKIYGEINRRRDRYNKNKGSIGEEASDVSARNDYDEDWKNELLSILINMKPEAFERLAQRLLREAGFIQVEVRGKPGDGGIDGVGILRMNLVSFQVFFQCKRWEGTISSREIRDFRGAMQGRADKGLFITTGTFSSAAMEEAVRDGAIAIDLIDGMQLCDLLKKYGLGIKTELVEKVSIEKAFFDNI